MGEKLIRRASLLLAIVMLASGLVTPLVMANDDVGESLPVMVGAVVCPWDPGPISHHAGTIPVNCVPVAGMIMLVSTDTLQDESCTTNESGFCTVTMPAESWLTITESTQNRPDLVPVVNPLVIHATALDAVFVHVVAPIVPPEPEDLPPAPVDPAPEPDVTEPLPAEPGDDTESSLPGDSGEEEDSEPAPSEDSDTSEPTEGEPADGSETDDGEDAVSSDPGTPQADEGEGKELPDIDEGDPVDGVDDSSGEGDGIPDEDSSEPVNEGSPDDSTGDLPGNVEATPGVSTPTVEQAKGFVVGVDGTGLVCHLEPDSSSETLHIFQSGDELDLLSGPLDGFLLVTCGAGQGYVDAKYVASENPGDLPTGTPGVQKSLMEPAAEPLNARTSVEMVVGAGPEGLKCYSEMNTESPYRSLILHNGNQFYATGPVENGWLPVQCGGHNSFVLAEFTTAVPRISPVASVEMLIGGGSTRIQCRTAPHPAATVIASLPAGTQFYATGNVVNGWLPVQCGGRDGYIPASLTTAVPRAPKPAKSVEMLIGGGDWLACRTAPHPGASVIKNLPGGTQFFATGPATNGWLPIQCGGRDGYIPASMTTVVARPPKPATSVEMLTIPVDRVTCHTAPHPKSTVITSMPGGTQFYATGPSIYAWLPVQCGGRDGFIPVVLTSINPSAPKPVIAVEMLIGGGNSRLECRAIPHPNARVIGSIPAGSQFYTTGTAVNGWLPVKCSGRDGYIPASATSAVKRSPKASVGVEMMTSGGLTCHTIPHPKGGVITTLSQSSLISITGPAQNGWLPVVCGDRDGFVQVQHTTVTKQSLRPATGSTTIFNTGRAGTVCRTAPSPSAKAITTFYEGTNVRTTGAAVHNWIPVQCGDQNGYIHMASTTVRVAHSGPGSRAAVVLGTGSSGLACRTQAGGGTVIETFAERTPVEVLSWSNGWAKVRCGEREGYVSMRYLTFNASDPRTTNETLWIDVNLSTQYMVVYQGERIIGQTYISSGRYPTFETPTGTFYINSKIPISAMAGCSGGECWYVPDVPHQMYFTNLGHAFHGAYWHNQFGTRRSHGCINLPLGIADWLYNITPYGTRVVIHY